MIRIAIAISLIGISSFGAGASEPPKFVHAPSTDLDLQQQKDPSKNAAVSRDVSGNVQRPSDRMTVPGLEFGTGGPNLREGAGSRMDFTGRAANPLSQLPTINLRYSVIRQPLPKTLQELFSLAGVNFVLESELTDVITNGSFAGSLTAILNDLGRRYNFVWTFGNGVVEIVHVKQVVSRTLKLGGGIDQARIAAILRASDIDPETPLVRYEPEASLLRVRGSARFVARVEAALNLAVSKEDSVNVIRYGRTFKVIDQ